MRVRASALVIGMLSTVLLSGTWMTSPQPSCSEVPNMRSQMTALLVAVVLTGCGDASPTPVGTLATESGTWQFAVRTEGDGEVTVRVRDRSGTVSAVSPSSEEAGVPTIGGISVKQLDVNARSLLVQVPTSVCGQASEVEIDEGIDGDLVFGVAASPTQCDAIGSYSLVFDLVRPVTPEQVVRHTSTDDRSLWGIHVGDAEGLKPLEVADANRSIVSIEVVDPILGLGEPPGIIAVLDAPDRLRLTWLADDCEDNFALGLNPVQATLTLEMRSTAIETDDCGVASESLAVALSFERAVTQSIDAVLFHAR